MFKNGITLRKDSWHIKFLKWLYGTGYDDFKNFCPYFWLLIGTFVLLPLILVLRGVLTLCNFIYHNEKYEWLITSVTYIGKFFVNLFEFFFALFMTTLFSFFLVTVLTFFIELLFNRKTTDVLFIIILTIIAIVGVLLFIILLAYATDKYIDIYDDEKDNRLDRHHKVSIVCYKSINVLLYPFKLIKMFFKWIKRKFSEFYKNNCPLINWR